MCNSHIDRFCFPITTNMCGEADSYCSSPPSHHTDYNCCCPSGEPCCIDCYFCLTPIAMVVDVLCFPCNLYYTFSHCKKEKQEQRETYERTAVAI